MIDKLKEIIAHFKSLEKKMADPGRINDQKLYTKMAREHRRLSPIVEKSNEYLKHIGYVPQKPVVDRNFPATIREVVSMGQTNNDSDKVDEALQKVWMHELADRRIGDLSGGQQQRVFIAKALVNSPKILVLDEPVTGVDIHNKDLFFQILSELNSKEKISVIWSSHDLDAVERLANKVACLNKTLFFHGVSHEFFNDEEMMKKYSETSMQMHMHHH